MYLNSVTKDELYPLLARRFAADGVRAYLWRDPDAFPKLLGFDIDVLVDSASWTRIGAFVQDVCNDCGWHVLTRLRRGSVHTLFARRTKGHALNDEDFVQIDLHRFLTASGVPYVDRAVLIKRAIIVDGAPFLSRADGATVSLLGPLLVGVQPKARYEAAFAEAKHTDPERVSDILRQALGDRAAASVKAGMPAAGAWRRALVQALLRRPIATCAAFWLIFAERLGAFFHPSGHVIAVSGPDGVGKTKTIDTISVLVRRKVCLDVCVYHFRPYLIPRLAQFLPRHRRGRILKTRAYEHRISPLKSWLRVIILVLDYNLGYWLKIRPRLARGDLVIFDRHFLDFRVDSRLRGVQFSDHSLSRVESLIPQPGLKVILSATPETIASRKQELSLNDVREQLARYLALASETVNCLVLETDKASPRELSSQIIDRLSQL